MATAGRPLSSVLHDIVGNVQEIVRSEVRLARTEISEELAKSRIAGMLLAVGALMLTLSAVFLLLAIVYALSAVMAEWAAALVVGVGVGMVAVLCFSLGMKKFKAIRAVPKTASSVQENIAWAKQLTK
jgi:uncharacterized membrane protein YqjE